MNQRRNVSKDEFSKVCDAIWKELDYQNSLLRRTSDEAKDVPGFLTLLRCYLNKTENLWADNPGTVQENGQLQVTEALHGLRKIATIAVRSMIYNGIVNRN
jgi:hypothetical protein